MKYLTMAAIILLSACSKKEDAPPLAVPHVAGSWSGNGTDNTIGYYDIQMDLAQSGTDVSGNFTTSSQFGTISGPIRLTINPGAANNLRSVSMTRATFTGQITCTGTMTLSMPSRITIASMSFYYKVTDCHYPNGETGGMNLQKIAGTN